MRTLGLIAAIALSAPAAASAAVPGKVDRSFGGDGRVETDVPGGRPGVAGLAALPGGKLVLAGTVGDRKVVVIRYRRDGRRESIRSVAFDRAVSAKDMAIDAQGRVVVAGALGTPDAPDRDALVLRFDSAGRLDSTFDGDGIAVVDLGGQRGDEATSVASGADGKVVLAAAVHQADSVDLGVARLDATGQLDGTFGEGGLIRRMPEQGGDNVSPTGVGVRGDGSLVVGGNYFNRYRRSGATFVFLVTPDGTSQMRFLSEGVFDVTLADLAVDTASDRLVLASSAVAEESNGQFIRLSVLDSSRSGMIEIDSKRDWIRVGHLALDGSGRALVAATAGTFEATHGPNAYLERSQMLVARFARNGRSDRCFGRGGAVVVRFPGGRSTAAAVAVQPGGRIVLAGPSLEPARRNSAKVFQLVRLHGGSC